MNKAEIIRWLLGIGVIIPDAATMRRMPKEELQEMLRRYSEVRR